MTTTLLVDGNGLAHKLWWADAANVPARFLSAILKAKPDTCGKVVVAWDSPRSWRRDLFPAYKAHRPKKPSALVAALRECRAVYADDSFEADGYEADDIIGTEVRANAFLCAQDALDGSWKDLMLIVGDDKDYAQLVGPHCLWLANGKVYNEARVREKFGVPPDRIRHLLSWTGDAVDGLPGVRGYARKRAIPKALAGEIGDRLTYELTELATVPTELLVTK